VGSTGADLHGFQAVLAPMATKTLDAVRSSGFRPNAEYIVEKSHAAVGRQRLKSVDRASIAARCGAEYSSISLESPSRIALIKVGVSAEDSDQFQ